MQIIELPARLDTAAVRAVSTELTGALAHGPVTLDGHQVAQIGLAGLQLLLSAQQSPDCNLGHPSDALRDMVALAGLDATLIFEDAA